MLHNKTDVWKTSEIALQKALEYSITRENTLSQWIFCYFLGHYIYVETSGIRAGEKAKLLSQTFPATKGRCLTFWYHMYGEGMGELNVYIKPVTGSLNKVWSLSGNQGDEWKMARVTLTSNSLKYKVIFGDPGKFWSESENMALLC